MNTPSIEVENVGNDCDLEFDVVPADTPLPSKSPFAHLASSLGNGDADAEGRRRLSSNFFDMLTNPQIYNEQVLNYVNENCQADNDSVPLSFYSSAAFANEEERVF